MIDGSKLRFDGEAFLTPTVDRLRLAAGVGLAYFVAAIIGILMTRLPNDLAAIWIGDALMLALLLRIDRQSWPVALAAMLAAGTAANVVMGYRLLVGLGLTFGDVVEVLAAAFALQSWLGRDVGRRVEGPIAYLRIQLVAAVIAPVIGGAIGAAVLHAISGASFLDVWWSWWNANAVGATLVLPIALTVSRESVRTTFVGSHLIRFLGIAAATVGAVLLVLTNFRYPLVVLGLPLGIAAMWSSPFATALISGLSLVGFVTAGVFGLLPLLPSKAAFLTASTSLFASLTVFMPFCISLLIEELRRERARIAENEQRFRNAMDHSAIGMALVGLNGAWIRVNHALCDMLGYGMEELKELTFQTITHPDDLAADLDLVNDALAGRIDNYRMEKRYFRKDGSIVWALLAVSIVRDEASGVPLYFVSQVEDITARKNAESAVEASENRWNFALESARQGVWDLHVRENKSFHSPMWKALLGYGKDELTDEANVWRELIHPDDREHVEKADAEHLAGRAAFFECEFRMRHKDGHWVWILDRGQIIERDAEGRPTRIIGTHTDITSRKEAEAQIRNLSRRMHLAVKAGRIGIWEVNPVTRDVWWDERMHELYGTDPKTFASTHEAWAARLHPDDYLRAEAEVWKAVEGLRPYDTEFRIVLPSGEVRHIRSIAEIARNADGTPRMLVGTNWDITENRLLTGALFAEKERLRITLESIGDAVISTDTEACITFMNPVAEELTGWSSSEALGRPLHTVFKIVDEATDTPIASQVAQALRSLEVLSRQEGVALYSKSGVRRDIRDSAAPVRAASGEIVGAVLVFQDMTKARELQRQLTHSASHDALTGLYNRSSFERELRAACERSGEESREHALCFVDLDRFKIVNDTASHAAGDALLREIGRVIRQSVRHHDITARLGGDEFGILLLDCPLDQARMICEKIIDAIGSVPFAWDGRAYDVGASIGITLLAGPSPVPGELLSQADIACYTAKSAGRSRVAVYQPGASDAHRHFRDLHVAASIRGAIENDRFRLYAQEIRSFKSSGRQRHFEVLLRMIGEDGEIVAPAAFIPAAERYDLMGHIDRWVIKATLRGHAARIRAEPGLTISINLSANSLSDPLLWPFLAGELLASGIPPGQVHLEITETALINNLSAAGHLVNAARAAGCKIVLDDFGSGLSSFSYLRRYPIDYLKIDGSFIRQLKDNPIDFAIVESINEIAHKLGAETVAECVEDAATIGIVQAIGVDHAQGFAIAMPQPIEQALGEAPSAPTQLRVVGR